MRVQQPRNSLQPLLDVNERDLRALVTEFRVVMLGAIRSDVRQQRLHRTGCACNWGAGRRRRRRRLVRLCTGGVGRRGRATRCEFAEFGVEQSQRGRGVVEQLGGAFVWHGQAARAAMRLSILSFSACGVKGLTM
jgi:hypothetical protein